MMSLPLAFYAFDENFVLPLSHDEVIHGKKSLLCKMPGDEWQRFANLRLLYTMIFTYPGRKLLFMGGKFGQDTEWSEGKPLDRLLLDHSFYQQVQETVKDLNHLYYTLPTLHHHDFNREEFKWIDCHNAAQSVLSYLRRDEEDFTQFYSCTPHQLPAWRSSARHYLERFNSDSTQHGSSNVCNSLDIPAENIN